MRGTFMMGRGCAGCWGRRSAIGAEIGHLKTDGRLARCPLKGTIGDALFAVLNACGHTIRKIPAHLRAWLAWIVAAVSNAPYPPDRQYRAVTADRTDRSRPTL